MSLEQICRSVFIWPTLFLLSLEITNSQSGPRCGKTTCDASETCVPLGTKFVCAPKGPVGCGSGVCSPPNECQGNQCVPKGSSVCGRVVCNSSQTCVPLGKNLVCAPKGSVGCGASVCSPPNECQGNQCVPKGSTVCGRVVCNPSQTCVPLGTSLVCAPKGSVGCGSSVCSPPNRCEGNRCVAPH